MTTALKNLRLLVEGRSGSDGKNRRTHAPQYPKKLAPHRDREAGEDPPRLRRPRRGWGGCRSPSTAETPRGWSPATPASAWTSTRRRRSSSARARRRSRNPGTQCSRASRWRVPVPVRTACARRLPPQPTDTMHRSSTAWFKVGADGAQKTRHTHLRRGGLRSSRAAATLNRCSNFRSGSTSFRAHTNSVAKIASPSGMTRMAAPGTGSGMSAVPSTRTLEPSAATAAFRATRRKHLAPD